jgi:zinc-binding alcohol dehydrogenase/oxidoreductase
MVWFMRAVQLSAKNRLDLVDVADPTPGPGEAIVSIRAAALNHRDVWIRTGQYAGLKYPIVPGSDGAGTVESVGSTADEEWLGREVIINPAFGWGDSDKAQDPGSFSILGLPRDGTLAEKVCVPVAQLSARPSHLEWESAAALPLAGLTAWRVVHSRAKVVRGERVIITGIGGGVALFALQFASALGAKVWVTSSSDEKLARARKLGATGGVNYTARGWREALVAAGNQFDVLIDGSGGDGIDGLLDLAAPGGRVVVYGATRGNPSGLALRKLFWRQLSLLGSTMGSPDDWHSMVEFVKTRRVVPVLSEVFPMDQVAEAFDLMERGGQFGKIVVRIR